MMTTIEKIKRYIDRTNVKVDDTLYGMRMYEWLALSNMDDKCYGIILAFEYGRAKGERHARKEMKKWEI